MGTRLAPILIVALVLLVRLPFLNQAIQGDDVYYLAAAEHAQIDPLHPNHVQYVFLGDRVDLRGFPHPPLNAWFLALLLALTGDIREVPFHAAYMLFSLVAALAMWSLARRFSPHPVWATLLFLAVPAFVVNGNSLESDLPFLAFWMGAVACFVAGKWVPAAIAMLLAALAAFQAIFLTPILAVYVWFYRRQDRTAWILTLVPPATILAWQLFERWSSGALPAAVAAGYMSSYGLQALANKLRNGATPKPPSSPRGSPCFSAAPLPYFSPDPPAICFPWPLPWRCSFHAFVPAGWRLGSSPRWRSAWRSPR